MKTPRLLAFAILMALGVISHAQSAQASHSSSVGGKQKLVGAWRLVSMEEPGPDGTLKHITSRTGMLVYTRDGHVSVQLMFPPEESSISNDYVRNGYEASFGSYDVNEETHTVTHHVQGSITPDLLGKDLPRVYQFSGDRLIIKSSRPDEHWSVTWEHY